MLVGPLCQFPFVGHSPFASRPHLHARAHVCVCVCLSLSLSLSLCLCLCLWCAASLVVSCREPSLVAGPTEMKFVLAFSLSLPLPLFPDPPPPSFPLPVCAHTAHDSLHTAHTPTPQLVVYVCNAIHSFCCATNSTGESLLCQTTLSAAQRKTKATATARAQAHARNRNMRAGSSSIQSGCGCCCGAGGDKRWL